MSKGNNNNSAGRRPYGQQPYDPNNSFVKKMATKMGEMIPQKSWISKWFNSPGGNGDLMLRQSCSDDQDILEETMLQPPTKRPRIRMDVTHPPGTFTIQPRNRQMRNQDEDEISDEFHDTTAATTTTAGPSSSGSFLSSTPANPLISSRPILIPHSKSNGTTINGTDGNSESGESTSGCSSLIPQMSHQDSSDRQNYINLPFGTRKSIIDNKLNSFTNNLQSPRSLFLDSITRDSMSNRRPSFSLTLMNNNNNNTSNNNINNESTSTSELDTNSVLSSPFYTGNTMFGGANAIERSRKNLASVPGVSQFQLKVPRKSSIQVKPSNVTTDSSGMSQTAKRIFEALENFSSPISDAKKIPIKKSGNNYSKKRGRDEAFDVTSPTLLSTTTRVGLRHLTRELAVPTVPDMLKLKRRQRLQDTTLAARKLISANSTPLSSSVPPRVVNQEYYLKTNDDDSSKFLTKLRARPTKMTSNSSNSSNCQQIEQVNLPNIALPITSLPTFDIALPKTSNTKLPSNNSDDDDDNSREIPSKPKISKIETIKSPNSSSSSKNDGNYKFSSPIRLENNIRKSLQSINDFTFSKPMNPESQEENKIKSSSIAAVSSMNFVWSGSSTAPRPKTNQSNKTNKTTIELKSGSVMDILGNDLSENVNKGNLWECSECLIKNNDNVDICIACKMSKDKSSSSLNNKKSSMENILQSNSSSVNENIKFGGEKYKINSNENSITETKDEKTNTNKSTSSKPSSSQVDTVFGKSKFVDSTLDKFKPAKDSWECSGCMLRNPDRVIECPCCNTSKPGLIKQTPNKSNETCDDNSKKQQSNEDPSSSKLFNSSSGFGDKFKKPSGSWSCDTCMVQNKSEITECVACGGLKPGAKPVTKPAALDSVPKFSFGIPATSTQTSGFGDKFKKPAGSWSCDTCMVQNKSDITECVACGGLKPGAKPVSKPAASDSSPKFSFGIPAVSTLKTGESNKTESPANGFTFGTTASTGSKTNQAFIFGIPSSSSSSSSAAPTTTTTTTESSGFTFAAPKKLDNFKNDDDKTSVNTPAQQPTGFTFNTPTEIKKVDIEKQKEKSIPQAFGDVGKSKTTTTTTSSSTLQEKKESNNVLSFGQSVLSPATTNKQKNSTDSTLESGENNKKASFSFVSGSTSSAIFGGDKTNVEAAKPSPVVAFGSTTTAAASPISFGADNKLPSFGTISKVTNTPVNKEDDKTLFKAPAVSFGSLEKPAVTAATTTPSTFGGWPSSTPLFSSSLSTENTSTKLTSPSGGTSTNMFSNPSSTEQKIKAPIPTPGLFTFGSSASQQNKPAPSTPSFQFNSQPTTGTATASSGFGTFGSSVQSQNSNNFSFGNSATTNPPAASTTSSFSFNSTSTAPPSATSQTEQKSSGNNATGFSGFGGFNSTPATPSFSFNAPKPSATPSFGQSTSVPSVFGNTQTPGSFTNLAPSNTSGFNFNNSTTSVPSTTNSSNSGGFNFSAGPPSSTGGFNFNATPQSFGSTPRPSFNFTGGSAPTAFTAAPQVAAVATPSSGQRKIKKAVRRIQPRT